MLPVACAGVVLLLGVMDIIGWLSHTEFLVAIIPGLATMKFNTALVFILQALGLVIVCHWSGVRKAKVLGSSLTLVAMFVAALTLLEYATNLSLGVDELFVRDFSTPRDAYPGRMSMSTAVAALVSGAGILLIAWGFIRAGRVFGSFLLVFGLFALSGYIYGVEDLYALPAFSTLSLNTSFSYLMLGLSLMAVRQEKASMVQPGGLFSDDLPEWRSVVLWIAMVMLVGGLIEQFDTEGIVGERLDAVLIVAITAIAVGVVVWTSGRREAKYRLEEAIREREAQLRLITENMPQIVWLFDAVEKKLLYVNPNFEKIYDRPRESLLQGFSFDAVLEWVHPADREERMRYLQNHDQFSEHTYRIIRPDGSIRYLHNKNLPVSDESGQVVRVVGITEDITERKKLEEQYMRSQRMESIGTLAGGIAHDLNNTLTPIRLSCDRLRMMKPTADQLESIKIIEQRVESGAKILRQVLDFSRGAPRDMSSVDFHQLVDSVTGILGRTLPRSITLDVQLDGDLWKINADATQIEQVLMNICLNAADAMPEGGTVTLRAENRHLDKVEMRHNPGAKGGDYILVKVSDTGKGILPDNLKRIFEPFFTTKEPGKGTGLGLATAYSIVQSHGGFITVDSEVGRGTTFSIYLPSSDTKEEVEPENSQEEELPRGSGETILVVDDEPTILDSMKMVLEFHGYQVLLACDGRDGLETYTGSPREISAVITDMMMPEMDGAAMIEALREKDPRVRIIGISGVVDNGAMTRARKLGVRHFINKPFSLDQLLGEVAAVLEEN